MKPTEPIHPIRALLQEHKNGKAMGIYSACSANPFVIEACMQQAGEEDSLLLVEATSNQVNQYGGYTGMTPARFVDYMSVLAAKMGYPKDRLVLGGDHLGPNPWQNEPCGTAMGKACQMVSDYVAAGFSKVHLDASMRCGDDEQGVPLPPEVSAGRAAELCLAAEKASSGRPGGPRPVYVVGTEVPMPGGAQEKEKALQVTRVEDAHQTIEITRRAFEKRGLQAAWERVIAVVVQPGVEFGDDALFEYDPARAAGLSRFIETVPGLVYEAHSTDYQPAMLLRRMVEDHFAILKVGPALTFTLREALFAMDRMEAEWLGSKAGVDIARLVRTLDTVMDQEPGYWKKYYHGDSASQAFARHYSYSDRIRYYWPHPEVERAVFRLIENLQAHPVPLTLLSQYMPVQYQGVILGRIRNTPMDWIYDKIKEVVRNYSQACRG